MTGKQDNNSDEDNRTTKNADNDVTCVSGNLIRPGLNQFYGLGELVEIGCRSNHIGGSGNGCTHHELISELSGFLLPSVVSL